VLTCKFGLLTELKVILVWKKVNWKTWFTESNIERNKLGEEGSCIILALKVMVNYSLLTLNGGKLVNWLYEW